MEEYYQHSEALLKCHNFKTGFSYTILLFCIDESVTPVMLYVVISFILIIMPSQTTSPHLSIFVFVIHS